MTLSRQVERYGLGSFADGVSDKAAFHAGLQLGIGGAFGGHSDALRAAKDSFCIELNGAFRAA